jgi:ATP-dependent DNA helicase DinG
MLAPIVWEINSNLQRLAEVKNLCVTFLDYGTVSNSGAERGDKRGKGNDCEENVLWVEWYRSKQNDDIAVFKVTPLEIAGRLRGALWEKPKTIICVSATLTVQNNSTRKTPFDFWFKNVGLTAEDEALTGIFPSPFQYERAVLLGVPHDSPSPSSPAYTDYVNEAVASLCEATGGAALLLFTSYTSMKSAHEYAKDRLERNDIHCLKQGEEDRSRLLAKFKSDERSVLFATDSFWEGVDIPGNALSLLVLARLPFRTPGESVFEARCENLAKQGLIPFMELSLPEAVIKFRKGFGRLIRNHKDRGVVVVLDPRIVQKQYGSVFLNSIPETKKCFAPLKELVEKVEGFVF